jgi:hypothetical protein
MKIIFELELEEAFTTPEKLSNMDIAKAMTEVDFLNESDLCEIAKYLLVYTDARAIDKLSEPFKIGKLQKECEPQ